jgi:formylglycine-generating enzyme required for sulfatase activity
MGNVWEWVNDWSDISYYVNGSYYQNSPSSNPLGPALSDLKIDGGCGFIHVYRGGSWQDYSSTTYRNINACVYSMSDASNTGFRCARSIP